MPAVNASLNINRPGLEREVVLQLDPDLFSQRLMLDSFHAGQLYEPETSSLMDLLLQPGDTFIDIGGHVGFYSMLAAGLVGPTGRVYVFEPERANHAQLLTHITLNDFHNVFPFCWAVGQNTSVVELFTNLDNDGGHALWDPGLHPYNQQSRQQVTRHPVFMVSLDDIFGGAQPGFAKLVKIDTEGNEASVLRGARNFLARAQVAAVIAEVNLFGLAQLGSSEQEMRAVMNELGYTTYLLGGPLPVRLQPQESFKSEYVYNLLFVNPQLQQAVAGRWPQDAMAIYPPSARQE